MSARLRRSAALMVSAALALIASAAHLSADPARDRTISFYGVNTKETLTVQYMKNGKRIPEAMQKINWALRDWRKDEATDMDPELIDLVWEIHAELGSTEPIHVISGFRSRTTNDMLRRSVGGQASESRHILGKAMDVQFPDVPVKNLRYSALIHERGGVGYYPTSATPFVHIDTDRVRAWPRLPRAELALLFPKGRTEHLPTDGGPITPDDVRRARAAHAELATQIAEFHQLRAQPKAPVLVASLTPPLPKLMSLPQLVERLPAIGTRPSDADRARLSALAAEPMPQLVAEPAQANRVRPIEERQWGEMLVASAGPATGPAPAGMPDRVRLGRDTTFVPAPAYDEEHPEELSYRPFPIAPFLTATSSADDPALARMVHPDLGRTLEMMLDHLGSAPPMRLRPGSQTAQTLWAQQFKGEAINLSSLIDQERSPAAPAGRKVVTQAR